MTGDAPVRLFLVDDQELVRAGFRMVLDAQPDMTVVGEAGDGLAGVEGVAATRPDVVLMDIRMPRLDGVEATRRVLELAGPRPRVLVLTTFDLDEYVYEAVRAGASGFLLKDVSPEDLVHAVRVVARGESMLAPALISRLLERFTARPLPGAPPPELAELTERELEVARLVARGLVHVSGFTPSDAAHVLGRQSNWNEAAARLGARGDEATRVLQVVRAAHRERRPSGNHPHRAGA